MEIEKKGKIRLHTISRLTGLDAKTGEIITEQRPIREGLGIEYNYDDENHYIVIAFIQPYIDDYKIILDMIGDRILDIPTSEFDNFKELTRKGIELVKNSQDKEEE